MQHQSDNRRVALIKSSATKNRFYALVPPELGIRNADMVDVIPEGVLLGIAYPCLEDGLNDFAVIRTTFETLDLFPADDPIRSEMMEIVNDARANLLRRLGELHDRIQMSQAHFLGTDYNEFKNYVVDMVERGYPRRNLDSMMKLNVFSSVAEAEGHADPNDLLYYFQFQFHDFQALKATTARPFIIALFDEVNRSVTNDDNYQSKYLFDKNVFQKFIAVMFVNYATTDPMFYGINRRDYGVSFDKDMDNTPLYLAIAKELREIEQKLIEEPGVDMIGLTHSERDKQESGIPDFAAAVPIGDDLEELEDPAGQGRSGVSFEQAAVMLPGELVNEEALVGSIHSIWAAAALLERKNDSETSKYAQIIKKDASQLFAALKRLGIVSDLANEPGNE